MPGTPVQISSGPPPESWTTIYDYTGNNLVYTGYARSFQPNTATLAVTSLSKANPGVVTSTAHGLPSGSTVTISGATGDWAALNGKLVVTNTGANTFTIGVDTSGYAGSFDGIIQTNSPQTSKGVWAVQKNFYNGSSQITNVMWADGTIGPVKIWDSRTSLFYS